MTQAGTETIGEHTRDEPKVTGSPNEFWPAELLNGGGQVGTRMASMDWSATPLGSMHTWSPSLRAAVSICLGSALPIAIYWGRDLALVYNDAWSSIAGTKHPWALGRPAREVWPEIWDTIAPLFAHVLEAGESTELRDQPLAVRRDGYTEERYFDSTFSPIRGESGRVEGIFNAVAEGAAALRGALEAELRDRRETEMALREASARVHGLFDSNLVGVVFWNVETDRTTEANDYYLRLVGYSRDEFESGDFDWRASTPAEWLAVDLEQGKTLLATGSCGPYEKEYIRRDGTRIPVLVASALLPTLANEVVIWVLDDSERRRQHAEREGLLREAQAARDEAERANRAKTDFLAAMSHELRTPLNAIGGHVQLIELGVHGPVTPAQREALGRTQRNQQHLLALINDVLNFAKLEAGRVHYEARAVRLAGAVADIGPIVEPQFTAVGIAYVTRVDPDAVVWADPDKLRQILLNLLSNAVKFTNRGGSVTVETPARGNASDGEVAVLRVVDTGIGIAPEKHESIFDPFVQAHRNLTRSTEGTGLGLAISRDLARGMGGELTVESTERAGSAFTLALPVGRSE